MLFLGDCSVAAFAAQIIYKEQNQVEDNNASTHHEKIKNYETGKLREKRLKKTISLDGIAYHTEA